MESTDLDIVITVINLVSKRTYFILMHMKVTVENAVRFFLHNVQKLHNLLTYIVSDKEL